MFSNANEDLRLATSCNAQPRKPSVWWAKGVSCESYLGNMCGKYNINTLEKHTSSSFAAAPMQKVKHRPSCSPQVKHRCSSKTKFNLTFGILGYSKPTGGLRHALWHRTTRSHDLAWGSPSPTCSFGVDRSLGAMAP